MASYSGNSSSGGDSSGHQLQNSSGCYGSEEGDLQQVMDQRKRKRMQSNRESARRSRMRKQKHLDDLMAQVNQLKKDNTQIQSNINLTTQRFMNVEAENLILRAQMAELTHRLNSLNDILNCMNNNDSNGIYEESGDDNNNNTGDVQFDEDIFQIMSGDFAPSVDGFMMTSSLNNLQYFNQPAAIMASAFHYC